MNRAAVPLAAAALAAAAAAPASGQPVFLQGADSTTITTVLPPRAQGSRCCSSCAGNDACPDCACWATAAGMLFAYWDDHGHGGAGPWEKLLPGGGAGDLAAYRAATQRLFDLFGGDSCEGSGVGLWIWGFCSADRDLFDRYTRELGYSFTFEDSDFVSWADDVVAELNTWKPVYYGYYPEGGGSHVVLLVGYEAAGRAMWLYNTWDYAAHVKGFDEAWNHCVVNAEPGGSDCSAGPCCDGRFFSPATRVCEADAAEERGCPWGTACDSDVGVRRRDRYCSGESETCDGALGPWKDWARAELCGPAAACSWTSATCEPVGDCSCECSSGPCCDGCRLLQADHVCDRTPIVERRCASGACGAAIQQREGQRHCSGVSDGCGDGLVAWGDWTDERPCPALSYCTEAGGEPECRPCTGGCRDGTCVPCEPDCRFRQCGPDGCGGECGVCPAGMRCSAAGRCVTPGVAGGPGCAAAGPTRAATLAPAATLALLLLLLLARRRSARRR